MGKRYACYSGTRNLYKYMVGAAKSLMDHTPMDRIFFLIEDEEFPEPLPNFIETIDISGQQFFPPDGPNMESFFTYMAMIRSALCYVLPDYVDKVLSLDIDTIVKADISELWELDLSEVYLAAVIESARSKRENMDYINAGIVMYNLDKLRDGKAKEVIEDLNVNHRQWVEQDAFSYLCAGNILELPSVYNGCRFVKKFDGPVKITHFAGFHPWTHYAEVKHYQEATWSEVLKVPEF